MQGTRSSMSKRGHFRSISRAAIVAVALTLSLHAAAMRKIDPGEVPRLKPNEGLVVVAVDSNMALESVHVRKDGKLFGAGVLTRLPKGQTFRLYAAAAGHYEWSKIGAYGFLHYTLSENPEYDFEIKPGVITYAGDLIFRPRGVFNARIHISNRGLAALDWLQAEHPSLLAQYEFTYSGYYPDPFPAFYKAERAKAENAKAPYPEFKAPPQPQNLPLAPKDLWKSERLDLVEMNAAGDLVALQVKDEDKDRWHIDLIDLQNNEAQRVASSDFAFDSLNWSSNTSLLIALGSGSQQMINIVNVGPAKAGRRSLERLTFPRAGQILDVLPADPEHILFASSDNKGNLMVHKVNISSERALKAFRASSSERENIGVKGDRWWLADGKGRLRIAIVQRDGETTLIDRNTGGAEILRVKADGGFEPYALSYDGDVIYGLTDQDRTQKDLVEFQIGSRKITRTVFSKPGVDVITPIFDRHRKPIGVHYYQDGRLVSEYFEQQDRAVTELLDEAFRDQTVAVIDRSDDSRQMMLWVDANDQPPKLFHLDVSNKRASLIEEAMPWLAERRFAPTKLIKTQGKDGLPIEAYLTLPEGKHPRPLIVLAHGGPVGISDTLHFDREVQFLASLGYAVLRVNFRGSAGFGKAFREAGYRGHGTVIEDDIDAALQHALATYPIDAQRMCALGFSYGGYSSLVSAVRWPDRYRCVISVSGVSDRILFFTASDGGRSATGRSQLEKIIGDPRTQEADMLKTSPLYHYRDIRVPVMLAHGQEDLRVDFEHTRRMQRMLNLAGRPPSGLVYAEEGHSFHKDEDRHSLWSGIAGFLQEHLQHTNAASATP